MTDLEELKRVQLECAKKVVPRDDFVSINTVGGIDLTFEKVKENPTKAWASIVVVELKNLRVIHQEVIEGVVDFPYIPTFLAFRELPLMIKLVESIRIKPDVYFIDGQGMAHPRGCGIASHFGVRTGSVSVGVAKTKLFGHYKEPENKKGAYSYLTYRGNIVGAAVRTRENSPPVFVSVGHRISLRTAIELVLKTSLYRIPEPTRLAHNLLQKVRRHGINNLL